jgi:hypothetical protein
VELFAKVGLQMNAAKEVSTKSNPNIRRSSISEGAHKRRLRGEPVDYEARKSVLVQREKGEKTMQHRQLKNHIQQSQHHDVTAFSPPSLYSPSPL